MSDKLAKATITNHFNETITIALGDVAGSKGDDETYGLVKEIRKTSIGIFFTVQQRNGSVEEIHSDYVAID